MEIVICLDRSTVRLIEIEPMEIEPMEIGIDRKLYFAKTVDRRPIEDRIFADRTITTRQFLADSYLIFLEESRLRLDRA